MVGSFDQAQGQAQGNVESDFYNIHIAFSGKQLITQSGLKRAAFLAVLLPLMLTACGKSTSSQLAAKVNNDEITVHQVNFILSRTGSQPGANPDLLANNILNSLIGQQLLVQYSINNKLDRDPSVMQQIEAARMQILAQAATEKIAGDKGKPGAEEIKGFYAKNPDLFEKRQIYTFHVFAIDKTKYDESLKAKLDKAKTQNEVALLLKSQGIHFNEQAITRPSEQWPMELLPSLAKMQRGDISIVSDASQTMIMQLTDFVDAPVKIDQATPIIEQYLQNSKKKEALETAMKDMRNAAKITYFGNFKAVTPEGNAAMPKDATPAVAKPATGTDGKQ